MEKILFNLASRQRPLALKITIWNIQQMVAEDDYMILVKTDRDDPTMSDFIRESLRENPFVTHVEGDNKSKIEAINASIPKEGWDILVNVSDDQRFTEPRFDEIIRKEMIDGLLHFRDVRLYKDVCCLSIISRNYYLEKGYVYYPGYYSMWCDNEATEVAKLDKRYKYVDRIIYDHFHYSNGKAEMDDLYRRNRTFKQDKAVYYGRLKNNFK